MAWGGRKGVQRVNAAETKAMGCVADEIGEVRGGIIGEGQYSHCTEERWFACRGDSVRDRHFKDGNDRAGVVGEFELVQSERSMIISKVLTEN